MQFEYQQKTQSLTRERPKDIVTVLQALSQNDTLLCDKQALDTTANSDTMSPMGFLSFLTDCTLAFEANQRHDFFPTRAEDKTPVQQSRSPREVIEPCQVCVPIWQTFPAARKENGGLRGSKATRWKR